MNVVLFWRKKELRLSNEEAVKILADQERRKKIYKDIGETWELKDKNLKFKNGVIVRAGKKEDKGAGK